MILTLCANGMFKLHCFIFFLEPQIALLQTNFVDNNLMIYILISFMNFIAIEMKVSVSSFCFLYAVQDQRH